MSRRTQNTGFTCEFCGCAVLPVTNGSYRNHCPLCLYSKHVDIMPGDRMGTCGGLMEPIGLRFKSGKGYQILHRCIRCGAIRLNRVADNTVQPDDFEVIASLSQQF